LELARNQMKKLKNNYNDISTQLDNMKIFEIVGEPIIVEHDSALGVNYFFKINFRYPRMFYISEYNSIIGQLNKPFNPFVSNIFCCGEYTFSYYTSRNGKPMLCVHKSGISYILDVNDRTMTNTQTNPLFISTSDDGLSMIANIYGMTVLSKGFTTRSLSGHVFVKWLDNNRFITADCKNEFVNKIRILNMDGNIIEEHKILQHKIRTLYGVYNYNDKICIIVDNLMLFVGEICISNRLGIQIYIPKLGIFMNQELKYYRFNGKQMVRHYLEYDYYRDKDIPNYIRHCIEPLTELFILEIVNVIYSEFCKLL